MQGTALTIKDLPVDVNAKLGETVRKNLSELIESEFRSRLATDDTTKLKKRNEIINKHKKLLKIKDMTDAIRKKKMEISTLEHDITSLGFNHGYSDEYRGGNKEIDADLQTLNQTASEILTIKHKLQTRLMLSTTIGEATVIMKEILGNGTIPCIQPNTLTFIK